MTRERGLIQGGSEVRGWLEGRRSQFRVVVKQRKKVCGNWFTSEPSDFADLEMISCNRSHPWASNPWVWRVSCEVSK